MQLDTFRTEEGLAALIQKRNADRATSADNFFSALEAKYGGKTQKKPTQTKRKQKKESEDEDDDEEEKRPKLGKKGKKAKK